MIDPGHYDCNITKDEAERISKLREAHRLDQNKRQLLDSIERKGATQREVSYFPPGARDAFNSRFRSD